MNINKISEKHKYIYISV